MHGPRATRILAETIPARPAQLDGGYTFGLCVFSASNRISWPAPSSLGKPVNRLSTNKQGSSGSVSGPRFGESGGPPSYCYL